MGVSASSLGVASSSESFASALHAVVDTIHEDTLALLLLTTRRAFTLNARDFATLFSGVPSHDLDAVWHVFAIAGRDKVDACELLATLVLAAPHLPQNARNRAVFRMFNVSKYRIGQLTSDEAIMLFRTVAAGIWQLLNALTPSSVPSAIPPQQNVHENLTRTVFGDDEVLSEDAFVLICAANRDIQELLTSLSTAMSCSFKDE